MCQEFSLSKFPSIQWKIDNLLESIPKFSISFSYRLFLDDILDVMGGKKDLDNWIILRAIEL
jgi:hypothetical protein